MASVVAAKYQFNFYTIVTSCGSQSLYNRICDGQAVSFITTNGKQIYIVKSKQKIAAEYIKYTYIPKQGKEFDVYIEVKGLWTENILINCK